MNNQSSLAVWNVKASDFPKNGKMESKLKFLIRYGILAPSGHNSQPWKFKLSDDSIEVWPDFDQKRSAVDPENRELYISLGCAAKNIEIAANYFGMIYDKSYRIEEEKGLGAIMFKFQDGIKNSSDQELFEAILKRQTNRGEYGTKQLDKEIRMLSCEEVNTRMIRNKDQKKELSELIYTSNKVWFKTKELVEELDYWLQDDIQSGSDGVSTGVLNIYKLAANVKYFLAKDSEAAIKKAEREKRLAIEAPGLVIIETKMDGIKHWIKAGEIYEELALNLVKNRLVHAFFNTVIELNTQKIKLAKILETRGRPQMFIRIGYPQEKFAHSGRRGIEEVII